MNPTTPSTDWFTEQERLALAQKWQEGVMRTHVPDLLDFVAKHRDEILMTAEGTRNAGELLHAAQKVIDAHSTIDLRAEMARQLEKISEHIWLAGERGEFDRERLAEEWVSIHAELWRDWRTKKYLYTAERYGPAIVGMLLFPSETLRSS